MRKGTRKVRDVAEAAIAETGDIAMDDMGMFKFYMYDVIVKSIYVFNTLFGGTKNLMTHIDTNSRIA